MPRFRRPNLLIKTARGFGLPLLRGISTGLAHAKKPMQKLPGGFANGVRAVGHGVSAGLAHGKVKRDFSRTVSAKKAREQGRLTKKESSLVKKHESVSRIVEKIVSVDKALAKDGKLNGLKKAVADVKRRLESLQREMLLGKIIEDIGAIDEKLNPLKEEVAELTVKKDVLEKQLSIQDSVTMPPGPFEIPAFTQLARKRRNATRTYLIQSRIAGIDGKIARLNSRMAFLIEKKTELEASKRRIAKTKSDRKAGRLENLERQIAILKAKGADKFAERIALLESQYAVLEIQINEAIGALKGRLALLEAKRDDRSELISRNWDSLILKETLLKMQKTEVKGKLDGLDSVFKVHRIEPKTAFGLFEQKIGRTLPADEKALLEEIAVKFKDARTEREAFDIASEMYFERLPWNRENVQFLRQFVESFFKK